MIGSRLSQLKGCHVIDPNGRYLVLDVESVGLHGEDFAVGYVIVDGGVEVEANWWSAGAKDADGAWTDREWVDANIPARAHQDRHCRPTVTAQTKRLARAEKAVAAEEVRAAAKLQLLAAEQRSAEVAEQKRAARTELQARRDELRHRSRFGRVQLPAQRQ
jgi:hypothetical protein